MTPIMKPLYDSIYKTYVWLHLWNLCMTPYMKLMYDSIDETYLWFHIWNLCIMYDSNYETYVWLQLWNLCMTPYMKLMYDSNCETYVWLQLWNLCMTPYVCFSTNNSGKNISYFFKDIPAYLTHLCPIFGLVVWNLPLLLNIYTWATPNLMSSGRVKLASTYFTPRRRDERVLSTSDLVIIEKRLTASEG